MKWHKQHKKKRLYNSVNNQGGLERRKAEQGRFIFLLSTRKRKMTLKFTYIYSISNAGIDSS
jgi:hypothetical protein